jgi:hypothetical protein
VRTLHTVGKHERLVARGQYQVLRSGQGTGKVEHWNLHRLPDGSSALRSDVDGRDANPDGQADRLHVRYQDERQKAEAQLTFFPGYGIVSRYINGRAQRRGEIELPEGIVVLAPCLASNAAHAYDEQQGGQQTIRVLNLNLSANTELLAPRLDTLTLSMQQTEELELAGVGQFLARHMVADGLADVRLDLHDVLLTRSMRDEGSDALTVALSQYTRFDG